MKRRTGNTKVARAIALALATVVAVTSVPATIWADGEEQNSPETTENVIIIEDENKTMNFTSENLTSETQSYVADAQAADAASDNAQLAANEAASNAEAAVTAADNAMTAANNAAAVADAAQDFADALTAAPADGGQNLETRIAAAADVNPKSSNDNAVVLYNKADDAINNETTGSEALITAANTAIGEANKAIKGEDGTGKTEGSEAALTAVNNQVNTADNAIKEASDSKNGTKNEDGSVKTPGTDALITAAANKLAIINGADTQLDTDRTGVETERQNLQKAVNDAVALYADADKDAQAKIDDIAVLLYNEITEDTVKDIKGNDVKDKDGNAVDSIKKNVSDVFGDEKDADKGTGTKAVTLCKEYAESEKEDANMALSNTWDNYYGVKRLVDNGSNDVQAAQRYAKNARTEADKAQQAADNAKAFAAQAKVAETNAKDNLKLAEDQVAYYEELLRQALAANKDAYDTADGAVDTANGNADKFNNGNRKTFNDRIDTLNGDIDSYNKNEVANANAGIAETNGLVEKQDEEIGKIAGLKSAAETAMGNANDKIDAVYGTNGGDNVITKANNAIDAANEAIEALEGDGTDANKGKRATQLADIEKAKGDLEAAYKNYTDKKNELNKTEEESKTAQQWADVAQGFATDASTYADAVVGEAQSAAILETLNNATDTSKDALGRLLLNKDTNYSVTGAVPQAEKELEDAQSAKTQLENTYNAEFYSNHRGIVSQQDATISDLSGQKSSKESLRNQKQGVINDYEWKGYTGLLESDIEWARKVLANPDAKNILGGKKYDASDIARANAIKTDYDTKKGEIKTLNSEITTLGESIDTAKGIKQQSVNALSTADRELGQANTLVNEKQQNLTNKQNDLAAVNAFKYSGTNTFTIDTTDIEKIKIQDQAAYQMLEKVLKENSSDYYALLVGLEGKYDSFKDVDGDTSTYKVVRHGSWPAVVPDWISGQSNHKAAVAEEMIEDKYETEMKKNVSGPASWAINHLDYKASVWDETNENTLVGITNDRCVIVCTDIDKLSLIRSTFAEAKYQAAQAVANAAKSKATAAKNKLTGLEAKETAAVDRYNKLKGDLENAENAINKLPELTKYSADDKISDPNFTKYGKNEDGTYEAINTLLGTAVEGYGDKKIEKRALSTVKVVGDVKKGNKAERDKIKDITVKVGDEEFTYNVGNVSIEVLLSRLEEARGMVAEAAAAVETATKERETAETAYTKAQEHADDADRVAKAAADIAKKVRPAQIDTDDDKGTSVDPSTPGNNDTPGDPSDDDDAGSGSGTSEPGVAVLPSAGAAAIAPVATPVITTAAAAGTTTPAIAATARPASGVAGVRAENSDEAVDNDGSSSDSKKEEKMVIPAKKSEPKKSAKNTAKKADKSTKKIGDTEVPLAATDQDNKSPLVVLWGLLLAAGLITIEEYIRRTHNKNKVEAQNELNDKK